MRYLRSQLFPYLYTRPSHGLVLETRVSLHAAISKAREISAEWRNDYDVETINFQIAVAGF